MSREEFGQLVAALREELGWTQAELAEIADLDAGTVSNIERGIKKLLQPDLLFRLADALQLTGGERRQFFLAASGLDDMRLKSRADGYHRPQASDPEQVLDGLVHLVGRLRIPCLLVDVYQDIIAANAIILELFASPSERIKGQARLPGGLSTMVWVFDRINTLGLPVAGTWEVFGINTIRALRESSLRYRARPYFKYIMRELRNTRKYPYFERYWRLAATLPEDEVPGVREYSFSHPSLGNLSYHVFTSPTSTPFGELYLDQLIPSDARTAEAFEQLAHQAGTRAVRVASWPEKKMPG